MTQKIRIASPLAAIAILICGVAITSAQQPTTTTPTVQSIDQQLAQPLQMPQQHTQFNAAPIAGTAANGILPPGQTATANGAPTKPEKQNPWQFTGRVHLEQGSTKGYIVLQLDLAENHYIYSITPGQSPSPSKILIAESPDFRLLENFSSDRPPMVIEKDPVFEMRIEKHKGTVQFFAPIEVRPGLDLATFQPQITYVGQVCSDEGFCVPLRDEKVAAKFAGFFDRTAQANPDQANQANQTTPNANPNGASQPAVQQQPQTGELRR